VSAIQPNIGVERAAETRSRSELSPRASAFLWLVTGSAAALTVLLVSRQAPATHDRMLFVVLGVAVALAQLFVVVTPVNQSYHTTAVFLIPAALLLPPELVVLLPIIQHVPDWLKRRLPFHIQTFNIANYTLATMGAWGVAHEITALAPSANAEVTVGLAGIAASVVLVTVNHGLLAQMLRLARNRTIRETGLFSFDNLTTDLVLASLGVAFAVFWLIDPWLVAFALAPLVLIHRSLSVPALQAEARVDPKTGLFNTRHFEIALRDELARATRFQRTTSLIMADLDLLRDINNTYGHLAGDAVLAGVARIFREQLRDYDVPARFGGEEFSILLPETPVEEALEIAERIRHAVARSSFDVKTSSEPIQVTLSLGVSNYPRDGADSNTLVHQADLAVYRAKLQGRNRVRDASDEASDEPLLSRPEKHTSPFVQLAEEPTELSWMAPPDSRAEDAETIGPPRTARAERHADPEASGPAWTGKTERRAERRPHVSTGPRFFSVPRRLAVFVAFVGLVGSAAGVLAIVVTPGKDWSALIAIVLVVGIGQVLSIEVERTGTISISAIGAIAGAAIVGPHAALILAITISVTEWSARRSHFHQLFFNIGALTLASLAAAEIFSIHRITEDDKTLAVLSIGCGVLAGLAYFALNTGLLSLAVGLEGRESAWHVWRERFSWLMAYYLAYGFIVGMLFDACELPRPLGAWALAGFALPLFLMWRTQGAYLRHTERSTQKLRHAAVTIQDQNASLELVNRLLKERSTAAMESLSATVDARDAYTAGHSRRVQELSLAIGKELGLSKDELELLGHAALFHDIGKLSVPDAILLKPSRLSDDEWAKMKQHAEEGASIINRLGFLNDAVPAIRHHHEHFDGRGYPDALAGEEIPLGARIIHVADAFDSMLSSRTYSTARSPETAMEELQRLATSQFCPRCVTALLTVVERERPDSLIETAAVPVAS
jgi:diguanylate cyclase (GGDEF)-like protein/putative nucleotidyltransferase with HDIG domain